MMQYIIVSCFQFKVVHEWYTCASIIHNTPNLTSWIVHCFHCKASPRYCAFKGVPPKKKRKKKKVNLIISSVVIKFGTCDAKAEAESAPLS